MSTYVCVCMCIYIYIYIYIYMVFTRDKSTLLWINWDYFRENNGMKINSCEQKNYQTLYHLIFYYKGNAVSIYIARTTEL